MYKFFTIIGLIVFLNLTMPVNAQEINNNKFGIHIIDENDLEEAANLVNSNGGKWGYVTLVIREDERNVSRWQSVFDKMRRLKLIPIVRLATKVEGQNWKAPKEEDAISWGEFLNQLNWPVKERLVVLFNEPNHAKEWGGNVNPVSYAKVVNSFVSDLKNRNHDFKILPAGLDLDAPNSRDTMEASRFFRISHTEDEFLFSKFDYWNSHSYPNPAFSAPPTEEGQNSIKGYQWEVNYLKDFGLKHDIKVFITETGWSKKTLSQDKISEYYKYAFENVWNDSRILAVTPFILNYEAEPFSDFAFMNKTKKEYTKYFDTVKSFSKTIGEPEQIHDFETQEVSIPKRLVAQSKYSFKISLKNTGQSIWNQGDGFAMHYKTTDKEEQISIKEVPVTEPNQVADIIAEVNTLDVGKQILELELNKNGKKIGESIIREFEVLTPPSMEVKVLGWFGFDNTSEDYRLLLSDNEHTLLDIKNLKVVEGIASIPKVYNVVPGEEYKLRIERKFHLYKEKFITMDEVKSVVDLGRLLPEISLKEFVINPFESEKKFMPF